MTALRRIGGGAVSGILFVWVLAPMVPVVVWALANQWSYPALLPQVWGLDGWRQALSGSSEIGDPTSLPGALLRSAALGLAVAAVATPVGAMAARVLTLHPIRGGRLVEGLLLAPVALPPFAVVMGLATVLLRLHVPAGVGVWLVLLVAAIPYTTYVMRVAYTGHDLGYEQAARTLGARPRDVLWQVHLPLLAPALAAAGLLSFLVGWTDYIVTLVIGGGQLGTLPLLVGAAASGTGNEGAVAALSVLMVAPPLAMLGAVALLRRKPQPDLGHDDEVVHHLVASTVPMMELTP